jgi:hypothetical protein
MKNKVLLKMGGIFYQDAEVLISLQACKLAMLTSQNEASWWCNVLAPAHRGRLIINQMLTRAGD